MTDNTADQPTEKPTAAPPQKAYQPTFFEGTGNTAEYDEFRDKFKARKTSDDCFTPPNIYEVVAGYVAARFHRDRALFVRPFFPGGDFEAFPYPEGCTVVDNPPFSISARIINFYTERGIKFFLFCQTQTCLNSTKATAIICNQSVIYDNGAVVSTSFLHNLGDPEIICETAPELNKRLEEENKKNEKAQKKHLPVIKFPDCVISAMRVGGWAKYGIPYTLKRKDATFVRRVGGRDIYGAGYLISDESAAQAAQAAQAARAARAEREKNAIIIQLTPEEQALQQSIGKPKDTQND